MLNLGKTIPSDWNYTSLNLFPVVIIPVEYIFPHYYFYIFGKIYLP